MWRLFCGYYITSADLKATIYLRVCIFSPTFQDQKLTKFEEETRQRSSNGGELKLLPVVGVTMAEVSPLIAVLAAGRAAPVWRPPMGEM